MEGQKALIETIDLLIKLKTDTSLRLRQLEAEHLELDKQIIRLQKVKNELYLEGGK